ncbi:MAG: DNA-directed RNA polymerase subunit beta, partial [Planctomycetia bacterium]
MKDRKQAAGTTGVPAAKDGVVRYGGTRPFDFPNLVDLQTASYKAFLQEDVPGEHREDLGLEGILREMFPIPSFDGTKQLEYLGYELGSPRYTQDECRELKITYGRPFKVRVRLKKEQPVEEEVFLGEIPIMIGGGEFLINGTERVIVTQLHRSPGVDFSVETHSSDKKLHSCWLIPERGSWIELNVTKKEQLAVRIDQSGKFPATSLLRAMSEEFSSDAQIARAFYPTETVAVAARNFKKKVVGKHVVTTVADTASGEVILEGLGLVGDEHALRMEQCGIESVEIISDLEDPLVLNTLLEDTTETHEEALVKIYARLRPGNPPQVEKAKELFKEKFFDSSRYRLGRVGRFRLNRKFGTSFPEEQQVLGKEDLVEAVKYLVGLRAGKGEIDDIDHLGNRRIRTIAELAGEELRKGFNKLRRTAQERMNVEEAESVTPRTVINSKTISSAIDYFFGRGELSQVVDQTNPLSQITHERRLSALGPGGLNRKRAGFEVRDVHISHYGRICPIETPEGANIGLISSLSIFSGVDTYGFLITPYRVVEKGRVTGEVVFLRADEELDKTFAPADTEVAADGRIVGETILGRRNDDFLQVKPDEATYMDVSPMQLVGVSAALIPFLEHDDANRALMGSNMQRQAVPLLVTEPPLVGTGMERVVAQNSSMVVRARAAGTVASMDSRHVAVRKGDGTEDRYELRKFTGLNERTCLNQRPLVQGGQRVEAGQVLADGAATHDGELALGRNVLVAFMPWDGYNYEDAILVSEDLVRRDAYTSIHID